MSAPLLTESCPVRVWSYQPIYRSVLSAVDGRFWKAKAAGSIPAAPTNFSFVGMDSSGKEVALSMQSLRVRVLVTSPFYSFKVYGCCRDRWLLSGCCNHPAKARGSIPSFTHQFMYQFNGVASVVLARLSVKQQGRVRFPVSPQIMLD